MAPSRPIPAFGTYDQERLLILASIEKLEFEQRRQGESLAAARESELARAQKDLNVLHEKVRVLEGKKSTLVIRNWVTTAALGAAMTVLFELFRVLISRR